MTTTTMLRDRPRPLKGTFPSQWTLCRHDQEIEAVHTFTFYQVNKDDACSLFYVLLPDCKYGAKSFTRRLLSFQVLML